jgi:hypothetical protein
MILADFHFPRRLRPAVAQMARCLVPAHHLETHGLTERVVDYLELQLRAFPTGFRVGMLAGIATLEISTLPRHGKRFSQLALADASVVIAAWWHSPIAPFRTFVRALKSLVALAFYDSPAMQDQLEYHPDQWIADAARRRLETWGLEIARHEEELRAPDPLLAPVRLLRKVRHA